MKKIVFVIISIIVLVLLNNYFEILNIKFKIAKFEKPIDIKETNESIIETIKLFIDSSQYTLLDDEIIFFNSWATWCGPCIKEIPSLSRIVNENKNVRFISYCSDKDVEETLSFLDDKNLKLPFLLLHSQKGLRITIYEYLNKYKYTNKKKVKDILPFNMIIKNDSIIYFTNSIHTSQVDSISSFLKSL